MKIWVGRHAIAGPSDSGKDPRWERERPLTDEGQELALAIAKEMRARGKSGDPLPAVIFCSTYQRAIDTADIYGGVLSIPVNPVDDLCPNRPLDQRMLELMSHDELRRIMFIGHHDNTTPAMNIFGGDMGDFEKKGDDKTRKELGYQDGSTPGDSDDASNADGDWVPLVMSEVRRLRMDRHTGKWLVKDRLMPSDIGFKDIGTFPKGASTK